MKRSVIIPLSRQEEETIRLISQGIGTPKHLRSHDIDQLSKLRLIEHQDGKVTLSELGQVRVAQLQELRFQSIIRAASEHRLNWRIA